MKRQRYERTDVPKGGPRGAIMGLIALVLIAVGGWFLVQTLWAKARFDSAKGDAELVSSVSGTPELKSVDGYTVSDHSFSNTLILIVDDVDAEAPVLSDARILSLDITAGTATMVILPTNVRVNPETNPQILSDLFADSGASPCVNAIERRCGIPLDHIIVTDTAGWESIRDLDGKGAQELVKRLSDLLDHVHTDMDASAINDLNERVQAIGFANVAQVDMRPGSEWTDGNGVSWMVVYDYEVGPAIGYLVPAA